MLQPLLWFRGVDLRAENVPRWLGTLPAHSVERQIAESFGTVAQNGASILTADENCKNWYALRSGLRKEKFFRLL
jgi:hypothetical protein